MKRLTSFGLTGLTLLTSAVTFSPPAQASFGDFLLGTGVGVGTTLLINSNNQRDTANRYRQTTPEAEFVRGVQDGTNGARYDNPRNSMDYDRGFQEGMRRRQGR